MGCQIIMNKLLGYLRFNRNKIMMKRLRTLMGKTKMILINTKLLIIQI